MDDEKRSQYDMDNRVNPMKVILAVMAVPMWYQCQAYPLNELQFLFFQASQAWMEWLIKKRKAFDQRGDMAIMAWAEQQQREMNLRARRLSRTKVFE